MAKRGQGTLEVKFQPVGDRKLILVLKAMQKQMSKIERRFQGVNSETKTTGVAMDGFFKKLGMGQTTVRNSNKGFIGLGNTFSVLRSKMLLAGFAMTILGKTVGTAMNKFFEQEKALMKLNAALNSTGRAMHTSTKELAAFAGELQKTTIFGDEQIISAQALQATFTSIGQEIFPQVTRAILDLSAAMDQDLQQTTIQVGKAINDPLMGMTALRRVGIQLTEEQQNSIKSFMKQNDVMSAQKVILQELQVQFGGMAEAMAATSGGEMTQIANSWGDVTENIGRFFHNVTETLGILPGLVKLTDAMVGFTETIDDVEFDPFVTRVTDLRIEFGRMDKLFKGMNIEQVVMKPFRDIDGTWLDSGIQIGVIKNVKLTNQALEEVADVVEKVTGVERGRYDEAYEYYKATELFNKESKKQADQRLKRQEYENKILELYKDGKVIEINNLVEESKGIKEVTQSQKDYLQGLKEEADVKRALAGLTLIAEYEANITEQNAEAIKKLVEEFQKKIDLQTLAKAATDDLTGSYRQQAIVMGMIADVDLLPAEYLMKLQNQADHQDKFVKLLNETRILAEGNQAVIDMIDKTLASINKKVDKANDSIKTQIEFEKELLEEARKDVAETNNKLLAIDAIIEELHNEEEVLIKILELREKIVGTAKEEKDAVQDGVNAIFDRYNKQIMQDLSSAMVRDEIFNREEQNLFQKLELLRQIGELENTNFMQFSANAAQVSGIVANEFDQRIALKEQELNQDIENLRARSDFAEMSAEAQEAAIESLREKSANKNRALYNAQKTAAIAEVAFKTAIALADSALKPWMMPFVLAANGMAIARIASAPVPSYEQGGVVGGRRHRYGGTPIEAEQGEFVMSRNAVSRIGLANLNRMNAGGGGAVTVNVSGNVLTQDFVENELAERIRRAVQRGKDFGIS